MRTLLLSALFLGLFMNSFGQASYWPFDSDTKDAIGETNLAASPSGTSFVTDDDRSLVIEFADTLGHLIAPNTIISHDEITMNIWFKLTYDAAANPWWRRIIDFGNTQYSTDGTNHDVYFITSYAWEKLQWNIHTVDWAGGTDTVLTSINPLNLNEWYMLTIVHTGDSAKLYLNAERQAAKGLVGCAPSHMTFTNSFFGKSNWPDNYFQGRMDDIKLYTSELSDAEILALYNFTSVRHTEIEGIAIYPKNGKIHITNDSGFDINNVEVYDLMGKLIYTGVNVEENEFNSGLYIVKVNTNKASMVQKLVLTK